MMHKAYEKKIIYDGIFVISLHEIFIIAAL